MRLINSLRFRVAFFFASFGVLLSVLLSGALFYTAQELGNRLMDQSLQAELDNSAEQSARNLVFVLPNTASIKGFIMSGMGLGLDIHNNIRNLPPGTYNVTLDEIDYRVLVADRNGTRYFMLFDSSGQHQWEEKIIQYLLAFALFMTIAAAGGGFWLAVRVISPVTQLAEQVGQAKPGDANLSLSKLTRNDEVGELARAFDRYLHRLRQFIVRESYFTADVSHELRTPLAIILGTVEVLEQDVSLSTRQEERIARIKRAVHDMIELTNALLLMAREHLPSADGQHCRVGEVVRSCAEKHQYLIADRPIHLKVVLTAEPSLDVEKPLLEIVIGNLIRNALFNTNSGSVLVRLEADRLLVEDTGVGMHSEELAHALDRFYKGSSSAGAGVGLSLVKRICDRYGWRISLQSQEGQGTTAQVDFSATT